MALAFMSGHIIYYHLDAAQLVGLAQTYVTHSDYLIAQWLGLHHLFIPWYC